MESLLNTILSESGFMWFLIVILLYWLYKIWNRTVTLFSLALEKFLERFTELVKSVKDLSTSELETQRLNTEQHNKILEVIDDLHQEIRTVINNIK